MDIIIKKIELNETIRDQLIKLSKTWANENICHGIVANTTEDLQDKTIYLAYQNHEIIGYLFGHIYNYDKNFSVIEKDAKVFEVDELYINQAFRSRGVGKKLFFFVEKDLENDVDYFTLSTTNKDRKRIFHFYLDELSMDFWSARFFKKIS